MDENPIESEAKAGLMTDQQIEQLHVTVTRLTAFLNLLKVMTGILSVIVGAIIAVALWVNNTSTAVAAIQQAVNQTVKSREQTLLEWSKWREQKDAIDTRMVVLFENQQSMMNRLQDRQDKIREALPNRP